MTLWLGIILFGLSIVVANVIGTRRVRRAGVYERGQVRAQTVLLWLIPGSVFAILMVLDDDRRDPSTDSTARNPESPNTAVTVAASANWHAP